MKQILVFGNSGAGKSTLAKKLTEKFNLKHLDLDTLAWQDTQPPSRKPLRESFKLLDSFLSANSGWVIEGGYADLLQYVSTKANEIFFLNPDTEICIEHCKQRPWEAHKYSSKEAQDKNLEMLIDWVKNYETRDNEFSLKSHRALFELFAGKKTEILQEDYSL